MENTLKLLMFSIFALIILNCNKDEPTKPQNQPPQIESLTSYPSTSSTNRLPPGDTITIVVTATDADKDILNYTWECTSGTFIEGQNSNIVKWKPPPTSTPNEYTINIKVSDGVVIIHDSVLVYVETSVLQLPTLLSPPNGSEQISINPTLSWNASISATSYSLQVSDDSTFSNFVYNSNVGNNTNIEIGELSGLTKYFWRVCSHTEYLTSEWSTIWKFKTDLGRGTVTDIDGNRYKTLKIGAQWWMAENLKVTHYKNGDSIPNVSDPIQWGGLSTGAYCNYGNDQNNVNIYGRLYNWFAIADPRGLAPQGWHIPTDAEWQVLIDSLGGDQVAGGALKDTILWEDPNTGATNYIGFSALPGGGRLILISNFRFMYIRYEAYFWSSNESPPHSALYQMLSYDLSQIIRNTRDKRYGFSIRCVKD